MSRACNRWPRLSTHVSGFGIVTGVMLAIAATAALASGQTPISLPPAVANETALFLAGLPPTSPAPFAFRSGAPWQQHAANLNAQWQRLHGSRLAPIERWSSRMLGKASAEDGTVFYPFGGPDVVSVVTYFPHAAHYILIGLEPVGPIPNPAALQPDSLAAYLANLRKASRSVVDLSFYRTNDMQVDFARSGVLPTLLLGLARTGFSINRIDLVELDSLGAATPPTHVAPPRGKHKVHGVEISATHDGHPVRLDYYAMDLSDAGVASGVGARQFLAHMQPTTTFVKAATYLMHKPYFSRVRRAILDGTQYVLEDDSGIPFHYFAPATWNITLFGSYAGPIKMFNEREQADLRAAYAVPGAVHALPFGTGYQFERGKSNLLLAERRTLDKGKR